MKLHCITVISVSLFESLINYNAVIHNIESSGSNPLNMTLTLKSYKILNGREEFLGVLWHILFAWNIMLSGDGWSHSTVLYLYRSLVQIIWMNTNYLTRINILISPAHSGNPNTGLDVSG